MGVAVIRSEGRRSEVSSPLEARSVVPRLRKLLGYWLVERSSERVEESSKPEEEDSADGEVGEDVDYAEH